MDDEDVVVAIDDEAGEGVGFRPDEALGCGRDGSEFFSVFDGFADGGGEEAAVEGLEVGRIAAEDDSRLIVIDAGAEELATGIVGSEVISVFDVAFDAVDFVLEDPWVAVVDAVGASAAKDDFWEGGGGW